MNTPATTSHIGADPAFSNGHSSVFVSIDAATVFKNGETVQSELSPSEARALAAELLDAADIAEALAAENNDACALIVGAVIVARVTHKDLWA